MYLLESTHGGNSNRYPEHIILWRNVFDSGKHCIVKMILCVHVIGRNSNQILASQTGFPVLFIWVSPFSIVGVHFFSTFVENVKKIDYLL